MDDLFNRIRAAQPSPLILSDDELAQLEAWAKAHGLRLPYAWRHDAWKANRAGRPTPEIEREVEWRQHLRFVLEYNRARRKAGAPAGSQSPSAPPCGTAFSSEKTARLKPALQATSPDERGYVESPADPAAYVPASEILTKYTPPGLMISMKELGAILTGYAANRVRWTRPRGRNGQPMRNRRSVHLGDWAAYVKRQSPAEEDGFPRLTEAELEQRKAAVRNARHAGK